MPESEDLALLTDAVREAGDIALGYWRRSPRVEEKPDGSGPVTEADLAVNAALERHLRRARPGYGWLSEESPDTPERQRASTLFIVDPIDGTRAFIEGEKSFAISVAIATGHDVTAGAVYLPALDRFYAAVRGGPATLNGRPMTASAREDVTGANVLTTRAGLEAGYWPGGVPDLRRSFRPSIAYRLCLVAEGAHDGMIQFRDAWEWDIAAASLIAERAGAQVTDRDGRSLRFNNAPLPQTPGVLAAAPGLHRALLTRRRPIQSDSLLPRGYHD